MDQSKQLKIFLVDDDLFYLNTLEQHIRNLGYENVENFTDGTECLKNIKEKPDVVFLDYKMDVLTGYEVLKKIKRFNPDIYIVMLSAQPAIKPAVDSLKLGAFDYIQKGNSEQKNIKLVLERILEVKELLKRSKSNFFKSLCLLYTSPSPRD